MFLYHHNINVLCISVYIYLYQGSLYPNFNVGVHHIFIYICKVNFYKDSIVAVTFLSFYYLCGKVLFFYAFKNFFSGHSILSWQEFFLCFQFNILKLKFRSILACHISVEKIAGHFTEVFLAVSSFNFLVVFKMIYFVILTFVSRCVTIRVL